MSVDTRIDAPERPSGFTHSRPIRHTRSPSSSITMWLLDGSSLYIRPDIATGLNVSVTCTPAGASPCASRKRSGEWMWYTALEYGTVGSLTSCKGRSRAKTLVI